MDIIRIAFNTSLWGVLGAATALMNNEAFNVGLAGRTAALYGFAETSNMLLYGLPFAIKAEKIISEYLGGRSVVESSSDVSGFLSAGVCLTMAKVISIFGTCCILNLSHPISTTQAGKLSAYALMETGAFIFTNWNSITS